MRDADRLTVLGIATKASNSAPQEIGDLWRRFHAMGGAQSIPARRNDAVYCVYCEYEGDFTKPYTVLIGCEIDPAVAVPEGFRTIEIEAGKFAVYQVTGELPQSLFEVWAEIWNTPLDRRYQADFDRYGDDGVVTVHVGVR